MSENLLNNVILYRSENSEPAVVFSTVFKEDGTIYRNRMYRVYSGHGYNRGE